MKTLEELLQAMNDALAASQKKPDDEALEEAYEEAKAAYEAKKAEEEGDRDPDDDDFDESKLTDEKTKKHLAKLRKENAKHRSRAKDLASQLKVSDEQRKGILKLIGIESEDDKPEEKVKKLTAQNESQAFHTAILESAIEHGIPKDGLKYYRFLVSEAVNGLEEGEELSDEDMAKIVAEVKKGRGKSSANSSVNGGGGNGSPAPAGQKGELTLEKFCAMGVVAKSKLYQDNPDLYNALASEAKKKKKLV